MHKLRVYVDTSVFGGICDAEFAVVSKQFFEQVQRGDFILLISPLTTAELENAPPEVSQVLSVIPSDHMEAIPLTEEISDLAEAYVAAGVLGRASLGDAIHVAAASVAGADLILSWNFRHIVNFNRIRGFNSVNLRIGCRTMTILSPREALDE